MHSLISFLGSCLVLIFLTQSSLGQISITKQKKKVLSARVGEVLNFTDYGTRKYVFVERIVYEFPVAQAPMILDAPANQKSIRSDSSFQLPAELSFSFSKPGLYLISSDSTYKSETSILITPKDFPKFKNVDRVALPIVYIAKIKENLMVQYDQNKKYALDEFWRTLIKESDPEISSSVMQKMIRSYYGRVTQANQKFSSYKEGWKTDRGMIFIIFGNPNNIENTAVGQTWHYKIRNKKLAFDFLKKEDLFHQPHFELKRVKKYRRSWYNQIKKWRTGAME